jgi:hypothetical protein
MFSFCSHDKNNQNSRASGSPWHVGARDVPQMREGRLFYWPMLTDMGSFERLKFRCKECDIIDCEVVPFEDDRDRVNKKRIVWRPVPM